MIITIPGKPIHLERHRSYIKRGRIQNYDPQKKEKAGWVLLAIVDIVNWPEGHPKPLLCPVAMSYEFVMPIPKSTSKKRRKAMLSGEIKHVVTPDISNLLKFAEDCLSGLLYVDDRQIYSSKEIKRYGENPRTIITVRET